MKNSGINLTKICQRYTYIGENQTNKQKTDRKEIKRLN